MRERVEVHVADREEPIAVHDVDEAPWYVDYCREACPIRDCIGAGQCIDAEDADLDDWLWLAGLDAPLFRIGRRIETIAIAGEVL